MATTTEDNNSGLYFIVGGILVAVVAFGIYYFGGYSGNNGETKTATVVEKVTPAAGPDIDVNINKDKQD